MLIILLTLVLAAWAGTLGLLWWQTRMPAVRRRVLINCVDDTAIRGVLTEARGEWLTVQQGELLRPDQPPAALDGQTLLLRSKVLFLQVLP